MRRRGFLQLVTASATVVQTKRLWAASPDRVIVIGAGIMGASIAYHLAKRGAEVTLLEKEGPAAGTTRNSFAWLNAIAGRTPRSYYELSILGLLGWRRLALEIGPDLSVQLNGGLTWGGAAQPDQIAARKKNLAVFQGWGYPVREVDAEQIAKLVPGVMTGEVGFGDYCDLEGTADPVVATTTLVGRAKQFGAKVVYPCEITGLDLGADRIRGVQTTKGKFEADYVVIAAGNGSPKIAAMAGFDVPLIESPGVLAHSKPMPRVLNRYIRPPSGEAKQNLDGRMVTGVGGMQPDTALGRKAFDNLAKYLPAASKAEVEYMTLGHRVMPKDGHPIFDRASKYPNLYVAAQHSGMSCAPIAGQLVSMEVLDQVSVDTLEPFRLSRFS